MKKLIAVLVVGIILATVLTAYAATRIRLVVDGQEVVTDVAPVIIGGRVMVPARFVAEPLGATVTWEEQTRTVHIANARRAEVTRLQNQITALERQLAERQTTLQALQRQVEETTRRTQDLERQLELATRARDEAAAQRTTLEGQLAERQAALQALQRQVEEATRRVQDLQGRLDLAMRARDGAVVHRKTVTAAVDPYSPSIDLAALGVPVASIDAFQLEKKGEQGAIALPFNLVGNRVFIGSTGAAPVPDARGNIVIGLAGGANILEINQEYVLKIYTTPGQSYQISFRTGGLPALANVSPHRQIILIPAMPELGFHWPYLLSIPSSRNMAANIRHRRYLVVDTANSGWPSNDYELMLRSITGSFIRGEGSVAHRTADALWSPLLMPVFPRPMVGYTYWGESNWPLPHSFDRDTALMHLKLQDPAVRPMLIETFARIGMNVHHLARVDLQLIAMIDHAIGHLNGQGFNLQPSKVFLHGFSASGGFVDRFTAFHPERVKAVVVGGGFGIILPLAQHRGQQLIFPIGMYDYEVIIGRAFSLARHNQVARLFHSGELDAGNPLLYPAPYGARERRIITELFGVNVLARGRQRIELYGRSGGHGMFIVDRGIGHAASEEMLNLIVEFFRANRDTDTPVYIRPPNPAQLQYTLFR